VAVLGLLEGAATLVGVESLRDHPSYRARDHILSCRWNSEHLVERCSPKPARRDVTRIFVLGGSSVAYEPDRGSMAQVLGFRLRAAHPGEYVVLNLARPCKDSFFVRSCVERAIEAEPDLIVIYSGHNDFGGYCTPHPRLRMVMGRHPWLLDVRRALAGSRAYSWLARGARASLEPVPALERPDPDWDVQRSVGIVLDNYLENLGTIVALAGSRSIPVVLVTVVGNLYEFPLQKKEWDAALASAARPDAPPWLTLYARGIQLAREGRFADALREFESSRDLYYPSQRAPSVLNDALRQLAGEHDHVHLVDFEAELALLGRSAEVGCNFFGNRDYCDGVHPNTRTNILIGEALFRKVQELRAEGLGGS